MKLSIIIPAYNAEKTIKRCLDSIVKQINTSVEIIIINDGSSDKTEKTIKDNYNDIKNLKYFYQKNSGVSHTRNQGIKYSSGEYLWFIDSDDYIFDGTIEYILKNINKYDLMLFNYSTNEILSNEDATIKEKNRKNFRKFLKKKLQTAYISVPWNKIFKKTIIDKNKIKFNEKLNSHEDYLFCLDYYKYVNNAVISDKKIYFYDTSGINTLSKKIKPTEYLWESSKLLYFSLKKIYNNYICNNFLLKRIYDIIIVTYSNYSTEKFYNDAKIIINDKLIEEITIAVNSYKTLASYMFVKNNNLIFVKLINKIKKGIKRWENLIYIKYLIIL